MIGVEMRVDGLNQPEVELVHQLNVAVDLFQHRVDDQRLGAFAAREHVAVGARRRIEKLAEDHHRPLERAAAAD